MGSNYSHCWIFFLWNVSTWRLRCKVILLNLYISFSLPQLVYHNISSNLVLKTLDESLEFSMLLPYRCFLLPECRVHVWKLVIRNRLNFESVCYVTNIWRGSILAWGIGCIKLQKLQAWFFSVNTMEQFVKDFREFLGNLTCKKKTLSYR